MKMPLVEEVSNAPLDYVSVFFYDSGCNVAPARRALEDQCAKMHIYHVENPVFEDSMEYIHWVEQAGKQLLGALDTDFTQHRGWWTQEPNLEKIKERIKLVLLNEWTIIKAYTND